MSRVYDSHSNEIRPLICEAYEQLVKQLGIAREKLQSQEKNIVRLFDYLMEARRQKGEVLLIGVGRCANILDLFRTRLTQSPVRFKDVEVELPTIFKPGQVKVVSEGPFESIIGKGVLAICLSGTGKTLPTIAFVKSYVKMGAKLILLTSNPSGELVDIADICIYIPGISEEDLKKNPYDYGARAPIYFEDSHPGPTYFELGALALLESIISAIYISVQKEESH